MIDGNEGLSLTVHPVQIYETILIFGIAYIVWRTKDYWKKAGSSLLFSLFLFFIFRFTIEFLRDPDSSSFSNNAILGVRVFQWVLLMLGIVSGLVLLLNEFRKNPIIGKNRQTEPSISKSIIYIISVSAIIYIFRGLFTPFELISLDIRFVPAILLMAYKIYYSFPILRLRLATTSFLVLPLVFLSQSLPEDTTKRARPINDFYKNEVKTYKRVDLGTSIGTYNSTLEYNPQQGECGTIYSTEAYKYVYRILGGGYSTVTQEDKLTTTKGINLWGGVSKEIKISNSDEKTRFLFGINPFIKYDFNWFGIGFGAHAGNLRWVPQASSDNYSVPDATKFFVVLPEFSMRVGRQDILDLKYSYGFNSPSMFPVVMSELSLGSGFGNKTNYSLRYGVAFSDNNSNQFISAEGLVDKKVGLMMKYNFESKSNYGPSPDLHGRIQVGFNYRFGFEK
jgi:phosphatidylglycerol:prolipoprotein diacylglycerol transferase